MSEAFKLTSSQQIAVNSVTHSDSNVCICGTAGTGKSRVIAEIVSQSVALGKYTSDQIQVCAPTGTAASLLGAHTVHGLLGLGPISEKSNMDDEIGRIYGQAEVLQRLRKLKLLIIDEISMVQSALLRAVRFVLEKFCQKDLSYGGVRVVVVGDMKQLPPVVIKEKGESDSEYEARSAASWPFAGEQWDVLNFTYVMLEEIVRTTDPTLQGILRNISQGPERMLEGDVNVLNEKKRCTENEIKISPSTRVILCATNEEADRLNECILHNLAFKNDGNRKKREFLESHAVDQFAGDVTEARKVALRDIARHSAKFIACKGASVMYLGPPLDIVAYKPLPGMRGDTKKIRLVNGSLGEVVDFGRTKEFVDKRVVAGQGMIGRWIEGRTEKLLQIHFKGCPEGFWVLVGETDEKAELEGASLTRTQFAIVISFAMTIHKAQGQTFDHVHIMIRNHQFFVRGLFYVAISRVKSLKGLTLDKHLDLSGIDLSIHPKVLEFFKSHFDKENHEPPTKRQCLNRYSRC